MAGRIFLCTLLLVGASSCNLVNTSDTENTLGRGPKAFDPYTGPASGAIRLGLQVVNGCAILATGEPVSKGGANIPYPDYATCPFPTGDVPLPAQPTPPMALLSSTKYFLNQITLMEFATNLHTDPQNPSAALTWLRTQTRFKNLDWTGVGISADVWQPSEESLAPGYFLHRVTFDNAKWMLSTDDTFKVEVLDTAGAVRESMEYSRSDFLASNTISGHNLFAWENNNIGAPLFPGDLTIHDGPPPPPGFFPPNPVVFRSIGRFDIVGSTHPTKTFTIPVGLKGDGAIRLTWSLMPNDPFYIPVRYLDPAALPPDCYSGTDPTKRVPCTFGLQPSAVLSPPKNGKFYVPGESFQATLAIKDGAGNLLHPPDQFPSWNDFVYNRANGFLYGAFYHFDVLHERDIISLVNVAGPRQEMRPYYELGGASFWRAPSDQFIKIGNGNIGYNPIVPVAAIAGALPGGRDVHPPTTFNYTLPTDAKPGTYNLNFKVNRQFMGERTTKLVVFPFQVGQEETTIYPGRVGNCQICHRSVLSLENLRHGVSVDHVEDCKACHARDILLEARFNTLSMIHTLHMNSRLFPLKKNDCTTCHLTRESATRPSYIVCASCHPQPHGDEYFKLAMTPDALEGASVYGNCAQQCHGTTPPTAHVLPKE